MVLRIFYKTLLMAVLMVTAFPCVAQQKMRDVFLRMPDGLLPYLTENNRLVVIISHVAELKNRIDRQIVVTKDKSGGSRVQIIT